MDFSPTDDQVELMSMLDDLLAKTSTPARVREVEADGFDPALWAQLASLDLISMAVPAAAGGLDGDLLTAALAAVQLGRWVAAVPYCDAVAAARLLALIPGDPSPGDPSPGDGVPDWLDRATSGRSVVTLHPRPVPDPSRPALIASGACADAVIALVGTELVGTELVLVPLRPEMVRRRASVHGAPAADCDLTGERVTLGRDEQAIARFEQAVDEWRVLTAAALTGIGARGIEIGAAYAKARHQFGALIGSFQAIAHPLADAATTMSGATVLWQEAAWAADHEPDRFAQLAAMAFLFAAEAAETATATALHAHGGYGVMAEYDIQLYFRRAKGVRLQLGDPSAGYRRLAGLLA
jgi:alkylation response protein AidB-like acyl-CoA dehydrogenase